MEKTCADADTSLQGNEGDRPGADGVTVGAPEAWVGAQSEALTVESLDGARPLKVALKRCDHCEHAGEDGGDGPAVPEALVDI